MKTSTIQTTYYDALYFASASMNSKKEFHLMPSELRLLQKLIHYSTNQENITWSSENISKHIFTSVTSIDKSIQRLKQKGYINVSTTQRFEKVKSRTIFINWDKLESVNKLALECTSAGTAINEPEFNDLKNENKPAQQVTVSTEITPQIKPIQVYEDIDNDEDDKPIKYSDIIFKSYNGTYNVPINHINFWESIQDKKGIMNLLIKEKTQFGFDSELDKFKYDEDSRKKILENLPITIQ